jgi:hypothetical protein
MFTPTMPLRKGAMPASTSWSILAMAKASRGFVLRRVADAGWRWVWLRLSWPASATLHNSRHGADGRCHWCFVPNADVSRCSKRCREVWSYSITRSAGARGQAEKPHRAWLWGMPTGTRRIGRALLGAGLDGLQGALDGHCNWKRSFKKALTSSWDLFAAASW